MSRRRKAIKREVMPDPKFNDKIVSKFTSCLMFDGKRSTAEKIVYGAFEVIEKKAGVEPVKIFHEALGMFNLNLKLDPGVLVVLLTRSR